jgi:DMSO/TMAO reductase YedYZ molybdopterin-dependent catalytic subunit
MALEPVNLEAPSPSLVSPITSTGDHFVRNHFAVPRLHPDEHRIRVGGAVARKGVVSRAALAAGGLRTIIVTLECAGNGRSTLLPPVEGEPWRAGAVSTAVWTGVPLTDVLDPAGLRDDVSEIVFVGADHGLPAPGRQVIAFARSLPIHVALHPDTILAIEMNGAPIPARHGGPVRLIVPAWYGMASVKWLAAIEASPQPFAGFFQRERYVDDEGRPLGRLAVKSMIVTPAQEELLSPGWIDVTGWAWSGAGGIDRVEVSWHDGKWVQAELGVSLGRWAWRPWRAVLHRAGGVAWLRARATDVSGAVQPEFPRWNRLGYGANGWATRRVQIR